MQLQWRRVAACLLVALIFLLALETLDILRPYRISPSIAKAILKEGKGGVLEDGAAEPGKEFDRLTTTHTASPYASQSLASHASLQTTLTKTVVIGALSSENTSWVHELHDWNNAVYIVDLAPNETSPTGFKTSMNKAREVTPYLTYIIDHYDTFPDMAAFVHAHRSAWHTDAKDLDAVNMLTLLRPEAVRARGFVNLRCITFPGCPAEINFHREEGDPGNEVYPQVEIFYPHVYGELFNMTPFEVREKVRVVAAPCCAQFAVSREEVWKRPKSEYVRFLEFVETSELGDVLIGMIMEYVWHVMFGRSAVHCGDIGECWDEVYGGPPDQSRRMKVF